MCGGLAIFNTSQMKTVCSKLVPWVSAAALTTMGGVEREVLVETSVEKFLCRIFPVSLTVHQHFGLSQLCLEKKMFSCD